MHLETRERKREREGERATRLLYSTCEGERESEERVEWMRRGIEIEGEIINMESLNKK